MKLLNKAARFGFAFLLVAGLVVAGLFGVKKLWPAFLPFDLVSTTSNTQVIKSVNRMEQVVLLGLGIEGLKDKSDHFAVNGFAVPGTERATFLQYGFTAKLGIEGKDVRIEQTGEGKFRVTIPEFIFIGHDQATFKLATEKNGALSFVTPEIDEVEMINEILNDKEKAKYIESNESMLRDQATAFYKGIITGVDPNVELEFKFQR